MDLRQLASFVATARTGSYAAAGRSLHLAQPAVWKHVNLLEADLGVTLFDRVGRGIQLTPAGYTLLGPGEQVLDGAARMRNAADDLTAGRTGTVTIGCLASHVVGFLAAALGSVARSHPSVRVVLQEVDIADGAPEAFAEALQSGAIDMVVGPQIIGTDSFAAYQPRVVCAVPPRHPWRRRAAVPVHELGEQRLLLAPAGYFTRRLLERWSRELDVSLDIAFESASPSVLVRLGEEGLGIPVIGDDALPVPRTPWPVLTQEGRPLGSTVWISAPRRRDVATSAVFETARSFAEARVDDTDGPGR